MSEHKACDDCGKCRMRQHGEWCIECDYFSCERGPDCGITHAQVSIGAGDE